MWIGSSRPNLARSAAATSGGTLGLVASSLKGSPGASARTMNSTSEMPSRLGTAIRRRRSTYWLMREKSRQRSARGLAVPVEQIVGLVGPAADHRTQAVGGRFHLQAVHDRDEDDILHHDVIGLDVERGPLDRIRFA